MKILEYGYYDIASSEHETKEAIKASLEFNPATVFVLPTYIKCCKSIIADKSKLGTTIDYPFGLSSLDSRLCEIEKSIKCGVDIIDLIAPSHSLCNRKYDKLRTDINESKSLCDRYGVQLRYTIDYKTYSSELLYKVAQILLAHKIDTIYPSNNWSLDNIIDNILVSMLIGQKIKFLNVIVNGNAWNNDQIDLIVNNNNILIYKTNNIFTLEKIYNKLLKSVY